MELLTPAKITNDKRAEQDKTQLRGIAIEQEESRLVHSLNATRDSVEEEKEKVRLDLQMFEAQAEDRKKVLADEIAAAERRRDTAMEPVERRRKEVEGREEAVSTREATVQTAADKLVSRETAVGLREESAAEAEKSLTSREEAIKPSEEALARREESLQGSKNSLAGEREVFEKYRREENEKLAAARTINEADAKANKIEKEVLEKQRLAQADKEREIADKYEQLGRTADEVRSMQKNGHS